MKERLCERCDEGFYELANGRQVECSRCLKDSFLTADRIIEIIKTDWPRMLNDGEISQHLYEKCIEHDAALLKYLKGESEVEPPMIHPYDVSKRGNRWANARIDRMQNKTIAREVATKTAVEVRELGGELEHPFGFNFPNLSMNSSLGTAAKMLRKKGFKIRAVKD